MRTSEAVGNGQLEGGCDSGTDGTASALSGAAGDA